MNSLKRIFHIISYAQYPFMLISMWFYFHFLANDDWSQLNYALILFGIAISFTTLQDTNKLTFKFEEKIWKNSKKGKRFIIYVASLIFLFFGFGVFGYFYSTNSVIKEVSIGIIVVGISFIGLLKMAVELFENFRADEE